MEMREDRDPRPATPERLADKIRAARGRLEGERKQVTVMFVDVAGSMALEEQLGDPEAWQRIMDRFLVILSEGVHRFEGTVDKFTGDGMMALFGAPVAHEDHARRACFAALALQRELSAFALELRRAHGLQFSVRIGLNSGEVVVGTIGEDLAMTYTAMGHTVGLANRMEAIAESGKVCVSEHTASLVEGYVTLRDLGDMQVKGSTRAVRVYELTGPGPARGRIDAVRERGLSPFVGRDSELEVLDEALEQALAGRGQLVGIVGEAGVGKSRLCEEFADRCRARGVVVYHVAGQAHARSVPLLPVLELLRAYFEIGDQDSDVVARDRIAATLAALDERFADELPLLFDFLAVPDPDRPAPRMDAEARQRRLLKLMKRITHADGARRPAVNLFEDLHWLDPLSEAFLANHVDAVGGTRSLTIVNFRPEYHALWMEKPYYRQLALTTLAPGDVDRMLIDLLGADPSLDGLTEVISARGEGNPFFIEELVRSLVDAGSLEGERGSYRLVAPVEHAALPASVHAVLAARIDRLAAREKTVLGAASVIGKAFEAPVLERILELPENELESALERLVGNEFIHAQEVFPEAVYAFKHPLTREVAYGSQLGERRAATHAAVARALEAQYPHRLDEHAALIAEHWEAAGEKLEAARWHARAGAWTGTSDPTQSQRQWYMVQALTDSLPSSPETVALGLAARILVLQYATRLGAAPEEARRLFEEAERIASSAGDLRSRASLLSVYGLYRGTGEGDIRAFAELARQSIALAEEVGDPALHLAVAPSPAYAVYLSGEYREGVAMLDRALELAGGDPSVGAGVFVGCPMAWCLAFKGGFLTHLGQLQQGRELIEQGRQLGHEQGDIETVGFSHMWEVWAEYFGGGAHALDHAEQALEIANRIGDSLSRTVAWSFLCWARLMNGQHAAALEAIEQSFAIARERRSQADGDSMRLALMAQARLALGDVQLAYRLAQEGLETARAQFHRMGEAYGNLVLAQVLLGSGSADAIRSSGAIEAALARVLEYARISGARGFTPLAHVELAELARLRDDERTRDRELREAHRVFVLNGAAHHAERVAGELAIEASQ